MPDIDITSTKNPRIKQLVELQTKSKIRRALGLFVIEGLLEIQRAAKAGYEFVQIYYLPALIPEKSVRQLIGSDSIKPASVSSDVFEKVAYRQSTGGVIAIAKAKEHTLNQLQISTNPLLLVIESVEKPGNIGALLRTADAAGIDGLIICDPLTDLYNPNVIRSGIGGLFSVNVAVAESQEVIEWLKKRDILIYGTALTASRRYDSIDFKKPSAIILGTEATGLSDKWLNATDQNIIIPMIGEMDSLNVSVSAAIIIFEAARQREFKKF